MKKLILILLSVLIWSIFSNPIVVSAFQPIYKCVNESYLGLSLDIEIGTQKIPIKQADIYCDYGCSDGTIISLGTSSGCKEADAVILVLLIIISIVFGIFIRRFYT